MNDQQLFFCGGPPKSGTTFLQRLLDLHPDISCPSEDNLAFLAEKILSIHGQYNKKLELTASRIGIKSYPLVDSDVFDQAFSNVVSDIAKNRSSGEPFIGISDNLFLLNNLAPLLQQFFKRSKAVLIFRNPIDTAVSAWKHNHNLYKKERENRHLEIMKIAGKLDLQSWVIAQTLKWNNRTKNILQTAEQLPGRLLVLSYEALLEDKQNTTIKMLDFLGCHYNDAIISNLIENSALEVMKSESSSPEFFASGRVKFGTGDLDTNTIKAAMNLSAEGLRRLGIPLPKLVS